MLCAGALGHLTQAIDGLEVDVGRMRRNLDSTGGLILAEAVSAALAPKMGRDGAHELIDQACRRAVEQARPLRDVLVKDAKVRKILSAPDLDRLLNPVNYLGDAEKFVERVLAARTGRKK
jgi:3-carboxy-cis,cis-muconate cycloisomerase